MESCKNLGQGRDQETRIFTNQNQKMNMRLTLLLLAVRIASSISQDVPKPTLVCRGVGCIQAVAPVSTVLQQRLPSGLVQTCFFNRCQISQSSQFSSSARVETKKPESADENKVDPSSPGTQMKELTRQASPVIRQAGFGGFGGIGGLGGLGGSNIFGSGGAFSQIFG